MPLGTPGPLGEKAVVWMVVHCDQQLFLLLEYSMADLT
jgi:hypothetical protein